MKKNWFGLNQDRKGPKAGGLSRRPSGKAVDEIDRFSNVVVVEFTEKQENQFSILRGYLKAWKKQLNFGDKEKKS